MDVRTLFLAQTGALGATAVMLWVARAEADDRNGLGTWTYAVTSQGLAYLLLANTGRLPVWMTALLGNLLGSLGVMLFFIAIRQFLQIPARKALLVAMVIVVSAVGALAGADYEGATVFNGFIYGLVQLLNGWALLRAPRGELLRMQRLVALFYLAMGMVLPLRAAALALEGSGIDYLSRPLAWQEPIYAFGFLFVIVTNLGFLLMCKMRAEAEVRLQAMTDDMTGLANRRSLELALEHALGGAQRSRRSFAVVMVDVDHFKLVNDRLGHSAGDAALTAFAARLQAGLRAQDLPFRYGGEEFCVLLPETDRDGAVAFAERLRLHVALPASAEMQAISASFGVAVWQSGDTSDALMGRADQALYRAKSAGRDRVEIA
jgi:diguanylate cyclase (GGDEF)-like protein